MPFDAELVHRELMAAGIKAMFSSVGRQQYVVAPRSAKQLDKNRDGSVTQAEIEKAVHKDGMVLSFQARHAGIKSPVASEVCKAIADELDANDGSRDWYIDLSRADGTSWAEKIQAYFGNYESGFWKWDFRKLLESGKLVLGKDHILRATAVKEGRPIIEIKQGVEGPTLVID